MKLFDQVVGKTGKLAVVKQPWKNKKGEDIMIDNIGRYYDNETTVEAGQQTQTSGNGGW